VDPCKQVEQLLKDCGAVLVRNRRHEIWRLPTGHLFVRASTPSDHLAALNQLAWLRRTMVLRRAKAVDLTPAERRLEFLAACEDVDDHRELLRLANCAKPISRDEFLSLVDPEQFGELAVVFGYTEHVPIDRDPHIAYYKSRFRKRPAAYFDVAGVSYIFGWRRNA
jgi:hypothetical protein